MKVAIIGASFARAAYLPALAHVEGAEVVAIASGRLESAQSAADAFGVPHAHDDWRAMLDAHRVDLVCIATPTVLHAPQTLAAIEAGAHVLCEKPTAMNAAEAARMLSAAEAAGRIHMIDHELRFNPNRARIRQMIAEGELGEIRHVNIANIGASWSDPAGRPKGDWWSLADQGGGRLGANGSHQVDLLRWWLGEVAWVTGAAPTVIAERRDRTTGEPWMATADDLAWFALEMASGSIAQVFMSGVAAHNIGNATQIFGSKGTITLDNGDEKLWFARAGQGFKDISVTDPNADLDGVNPGIWNVSVVSVMRELAAAIDGGRPLARGATFADGLANQKVLDAVRVSGAERRWVRPDDVHA
ncbi:MULTISPECIES: Gfo/Idh/MocA family oxidoreductase [unclassified Roseitalea]|uniref:Gfo/Idh/MocA family protein n=1 Tax=unclassified Roseitalea TaxID=2639107 RepID=UPI00273EDCCA|nr:MULTISPECIES: Gfo/Idh/MocA family oxidoreductase [unclassified Roseitalea]